MTTAQLDHLSRIDAHCESKLAASEYIPHYSESAEAGWRATRAAIATALDCESWDAMIKEMYIRQDAEAILESILAAFPLESLKP